MDKIILNVYQPDYTRPIFTDNDELEIVDGRHPMIELLRPHPFTPNTVRMGSSPGEPRSKIITGPNMGGWVIYYDASKDDLTVSYSERVPP